MFINKHLFPFNEIISDSFNFLLDVLFFLILTHKPKYSYIKKVFRIEIASVT